MVKVKTAIIGAISLLLISCISRPSGKSSLLQQMQQAEELVNFNPDSALLILQTLPEKEALPLLLQASEDIAKTENYRLGSMYEMAIGIIYSNHNEPQKTWDHTQKAFGYALKTKDSMIIASTYKQITSLMGGAGRDYYNDLDFINKQIDYSRQLQQLDSFLLNVDSMPQLSDSEEILISKGKGRRELVNAEIEMDDNTLNLSMNLKLLGIIILTISILGAIFVYKFKKNSLDKNAEIKRYKFQIRENNKSKAQNQLQIAQLQEKINEQQKDEEEQVESHQTINENLYNRNLFYTDQIVSLVSDFKKLKKNPRTLTEAEIVTLKQDVNQYFDAYIDRLVRKVPSLTDGDLELCSLIKLGIPIKDISIILNIDSASVSTRKYRMQKRIIETIGTFDPHDSMDDWLRSL